MNQKRLLFPLSCLILLILCDQLIKITVEHFLPYQNRLEIFPFLSLYRTHNYGISFSFFHTLPSIILLLIAFFITIFVLILWWRTPYKRFILRLGFLFIIAGAIGNFIDRAYYGYVVDYVLFHIKNWSFAVFNLADVYISIGAALVILTEIFYKKS